MVNEKACEEWQHIYKNTELGGFKTKDPVAREWRKKCEHKRMDEVIKKYFPNNEKLSVLDVGCGDGNFAFYFAEKGYDVLAFDFSEHAINENIKKNTYKNLEFQVGDVVLFETKKKFDIVFVGGVFVYLSNDNVGKVYKKLKNSLKENGILILREPVSREKECIKDLSNYREVKNYINLDENKMLEYWRNDCGVYNLAYSKLKQMKIQFLLPVLKPFLDFRNYICRKIDKRPQIAMHYYIFEK